MSDYSDGYDDTEDEYGYPEVEPDEPGYADGLFDSDEEETPWNEAMRLEQLVKKIRARYEAQARPLTAQQRRNHGVRLPALAQLDLECEREINAVLKAHSEAAAYARAARDISSGRAQARAQERQRAQGNLTAFAQDLGRGRRLQAPESAGRSVHDTWIW